MHGSLVLLTLWFFLVLCGVFWFKTPDRAWEVVGWEGMGGAGLMVGLVKRQRSAYLSFRTSLTFGGGHRNIYTIFTFHFSTKLKEGALKTGFNFRILVTSYFGFPFIFCASGILQPGWLGEILVSSYIGVSSPSCSFLC